MNTESDYIENQKRICRDEWFKEHRATVLGDTLVNNVCVTIGWEKPGTWNYGSRFIIYRRWLVVVGDIGEAVFEWGQDLTLEFLGGLDFGYFLSKCRASPEGMKFEQWNPRLAYGRKEEYVANYHDNASRADEMAARLVGDLVQGSAKEDYECVARKIYDKTGDAELASMIAAWGMAPSVHAIGMFVGLQMAIEQLKERK